MCKTTPSASEFSFKAIETAAAGTIIDLDTVLQHLKWNQHELIPCIAQQYDTKEVLMMAWMNRAALEETLATGQVCYWSRSRQCYWRKGESSGHRQRLVSLRADCDGDALVAMVDQTGAACHTYRRDCFYVELTAQGATIMSDPGKH